MVFKKLFRTRDEYFDYVWKFIAVADGNIWKDEDHPHLQLFFNNQHTSEDWTPEIKASYDYYTKCYESYAWELFTIRDAKRLFNEAEVYKFFNISYNTEADYDEEGNYIDPDGNIILEDTRENMAFEDEDFIFPIVFVGWMESSWDKAGDGRVMFSQIVSLADFDK